MPNPQPARGMRDFLPDDVRRREYVIGAIRRVYERYGFEPLETPAAENIETLLGQYGEEGNRLIFRILRRGEHEELGEADLALRYDLTVPLARVVAQYQGQLPKFFKRYQIQPVWRADRPACGRFREFYQCDIDAIGSTSPVVEVEQLSAVSEALTTLGFSDFKIRLNHRQLLPLVLREFFQIPESAHAQALIALDKLDKIHEEGVAQDLEQRGLTTRKVALQALHGVRQAVDVPTLPPAVASAALNGLRQAMNVPTVSPALALVTPRSVQAAGPGAQPRDVSRRGAPDTVFRELEEILRLSETTPAAGRLVFDPFLARGLSYYTGAIMEVTVPDLSGSLGGGGRYDNLIGVFLGRDVPACGFSLGLERIIVVMAERGMFPATVARGAIDVMLTIWPGAAERDEDPQTALTAAQVDTLALAAELRQVGLRADVYPEADKLGRQFKYAASRGVPFVTIVGDDERARGDVAMKDLRSGKQTSVPRAQAAAFLAARLHG